MQETFYQLFEQYGIYAVFALCTVEGDITLLLAGVLAHQGYFGPFSFLKVYIFGTLGGMVGDTFGYFVGRLFQTKAESRIKSNLIVFVTAQIIDPTGRPLRGTDAAAGGVGMTDGGDAGIDPGVLPPL